VKNRSKARVSGFDLQRLETRTLMSSNPLAVTLSKGVLRIVGSTHDDQIAVSRSGTSWTVAKGTWTKTLAGTVAKLSVNAKAGNDKVSLTPRPPAPRCWWATSVTTRSPARTPRHRSTAGRATTRSSADRPTGLLRAAADRFPSRR